jgi:diguanylate cyclase (GGDEF)-like protein/PAS domain S-box-containing protein
MAAYTMGLPGGVLDRRALQRLNAQIVDHAMEGIWVVGDDGLVVLANPAMAAMLGHQHPEELVGRRLTEFLDGTEELRLEADRRTVVAGGSVRRFGRLVRRDGETVPVLLRIVRLAEAAVDLLTISDLTDWKAAQDERDEARRRLSASEARYRQIVETAEEGIVILSGDRVITFANQRAADLLGGTVPEVVGRTVSDFHPTTVGEVSLDRGQRELVVHRMDGHVVHVLANTSPLVGDHGEPAGTLVMITDLTERKAYEEHLEFQAYHDPLTGLPNRLLLHDRLQQSVHHARRHGSMLAVTFLDLDGFKAVNTAHGHDGGDQLLLQVAARFAATLRGSDTLARFGGDEFVVVSEGGRAEVDQLCRRLRSALAAPFVLRGDEVRITVSAGIRVDDGTSAPETLLRDADVALLHAKAKGRDRTEHHGAGRGAALASPFVQR